MKLRFALLTLLVSCAKPDQPPLTAREKLFLDSLSRAEQCKVYREIDLMLLGRFYKKGDRGGYTLIFPLDCDRLLHLSNDVAEVKAHNITKILYQNVLLADPKYNNILISFTCDTSHYRYQDRDYEYNVDTLQ